MQIYLKASISSRVRTSKIFDQLIDECRIFPANHGIKRIKGTSEVTVVLRNEGNGKF